VLDYLEARILRIFPGLFVAVLFSAFVIGPLFTTIELSEYFRATQVYEYVIINSTLILDKIQLRYALPGVFVDNPLWAVNGSLWTLPYEIWMYMALLLLGIGGVLSGRRRTNVILVLLAVALWTSYLFTDQSMVHALHQKGANVVRFGSMFLTGSAFYVNRDRVPVQWTVAAVLGLGLLFMWRGPYTHTVMIALSLAYVVFWLGFVPAGALRAFNRAGDYSYGLYIYAFPVQQGVIATFPGMRPLGIFALASIVTLCLAVASWHLVERPMLRRKGWLRQRSVLGHGSSVHERAHGSGQ
jgi:peptidoglycan/LPS O-acetylase OafA/YrhL